MALINELQVGRFNRLAQKLLSMKGHAAVNTLSPELSLALNPFHGAENRYLESWDLFGVFDQVTAIAAQTGVSSIRNPAGSGVVAVVTRLYIIDSSTGTAASVSGVVLLQRNMTTDQNTLTTTQGWDLRTRPASTLIVSHNTAAPAASGGTGVIINGIGQPANIGVDTIPTGNEIPLVPGTGLRVQTGAVNNGLVVLYWWRERSLEDSELR
jgi:hypothetical protein